MMVLPPIRGFWFPSHHLQAHPSGHAVVSVMELHQNDLMESSWLRRSLEKNPAAPESFVPRSRCIAVARRQGGRIRASLANQLEELAVFD